MVWWLVAFSCTVVSSSPATLPLVDHKYKYDSCILKLFHFDCAECHLSFNLFFMIFIHWLLLLAVFLRSTSSVLLYNTHSWWERGLELTFDRELAVSFWSQLLHHLWGRVQIKTYCWWVFFVVCLFIVCVLGFVLFCFFYWSGARVTKRDLELSTWVPFYILSWSFFFV